MNSLDTNILIYAANEDAPEHPMALEVVNAMLAEPDHWVLAGQVLFEFYRAVRNPKILQRPLTASQATARLRFLLEQTGILICNVEAPQFPLLLSQLEKRAFPFQRTHDAVLATTLLANGVQTFYTRNLKDFQQAGFRTLINPIDSKR
jgi:predicted nucleic acid-binding protein